MHLISGIKIASGELIGIINSDDMLTDNSLNIIAKNIKPETDVIYGNAIMFGGREVNYRCKPADSLEVAMRKKGWQLFIPQLLKKICI